MAKDMMSEAAAAQEELIEEFRFFDNWMDRYQYLIDLGRRLPEFPETDRIDDNKIRVSFVETVFKLFGNEVKRQPTEGTGVWKQLYVESGQDGSAKLRVMRTPSLFVLRQREGE